MIEPVMVQGCDVVIGMVDIDVEVVVEVVVVDAGLVAVVADVVVVEPLELDKEQFEH